MTACHPDIQEAAHPQEWSRKLPFREGGIQQEVESSVRTSAARAVDAGCKGTLPSSERRFLDRALRDYEFSLYKSMRDPSRLFLMELNLSSLSRTGKAGPEI